MVDLAETIFRDFVSDGVPSSGKHQPRKAKIREWGTWLEGMVQAFSTNGGLIYQTKADLDEDLSPGTNASAWVVSDATPANNGIYRKIGAAGTGSWVRVADLPYSYIKATDAGAGTANAIQATSAVPIPSVDGAALISLNIFENNTGPTTVSFNGGPALTIKTNSGADIQSGYLVAGSIVAGYVSGSTFRLISDVASAADRAAAEDAADRAEAAAAGVNLPPIQAGDAGKQLYVTPDELGYELKEPSTGLVDSPASLATLDTSTTTEAMTKDGGSWQFESGDFSALVAADGVGNFVAGDVATTLGAWVRRYDYKLRGPDFGAVADSNGTSGNGSDNYAAFAKMLATAKARGGGEIHLPPGRNGSRYRIGTATTLKIARDDIQIIGHKRATRIFVDHGQPAFDFDTGDALEPYVRNAGFVGLDVRNTSAGGVMVRFTGGLVYGEIDDCYFQQNAAAAPAWLASYTSGNGQIIESVFKECFLDTSVAGTHTAAIAAFSTSIGAVIQGNEFRGLRLHSRGSTSTQALHIISSNATVGNRGNIIERITGEMNAGGLLNLLGFQNGRVCGITCYDLIGHTVQNDMIVMGSSGANVKSSGNLIENYRRNNGTLGATKYDIRLLATTDKTGLKYVTADAAAASACAVNVGGQAVTLEYVEGAINTGSATVIA